MSIGNSFIAALSGIIVTVSSAHARDGDWRFGVDVHGSTLGLPTVGLGGLAGLVGATGPAVELERRLTRALWLWLRGTATWSDSDTVSALNGGLGLGVRLLVNPEDRLRIGWSLGVMGSLSRTEVSEGASVSEMSAVSLVLGVTGDFELVEGLDLRLGVDVARVGLTFAHQRVTSDGETVTHDDDGLSAGLAVSPHLGLALAF